MADFKFDADAFTRRAVEAVRERSSDHMLQIAREVQREMGTEADGLTFEYVTSDAAIAPGERKGELGQLKIHGPLDIVKRFRERLHARFGE